MAFADGYVSPQNLMNTRSPVFGASFINPQHQSPAIPSKGYRTGAKLQHVGYLKPGKQHRLSQDPVPTAQSMLDGSYAIAVENMGEPDIVVYVPRSPEYCGQPSLASVVFTVHGKPGPYLSDLIKGRVTVDAPSDELFKPMGWHRTSLTIDWPGVTTRTDYLACSDKSNFRTRVEVAATVAARVADLLKEGKAGKFKWGPQAIDSRTSPWNMAKIDYRDVRLIGMNYYRKTWVPVLAMDA
ncbi:hypothetical protein GALMADRAFT_222002 [Galerina marginata CBS 339.88]|uniref:Uncharacterized protein n=1 Tax=Galerina marginata (strain CBS 339.88) TaxID=685588 RepID=A0A067TG47_GALM3|nr:hypothetical protein GALMADRAFT_222002 [Galerina marginata CBS 339.88]